MNNTLYSHKVTDGLSFVKFLDLLRQDFFSNPSDWVNKTLPDFLEALGAYIEDLEGYYDNMQKGIDADKADWQTFADIFKGAKVYE